MFTDEHGRELPYVMGCYGIGVSRIVAAAAEQCHDEAGLMLPKALAPFGAVVIPTNMDQTRVVDAAERLYAALQHLGVDAVIDDRDTSAGVKFADADLIGFPVQVVVGARGLERGTVDLKLRATGERSSVSADEAPARARGLLESAP